MGNRVSRPDGHADRPYEYGGSANLPYDAEPSHLRGGDASYGRGGAEKGHSESREQRPPVRGVAPPGSNDFDFNESFMDPPWRIRTRDAQQCSKIRRFAECADEELLTYLELRQISPDFLREIDLFIKSHPELADCHEGRELLHELNDRRPLEAYLCFLRGYTRPARYIDGVIRTTPSRLHPSFPYSPLSKKYDLELDLFFEGHEWRHDIIDKIDREVQAGMRNMNDGFLVPQALCKLISYALWGNPVDAYKYYEYSYQRDYLPHHYVPEHCVLDNVPSKTIRTLPRVTVDITRKKHMDVRRRMARAQDQGVDVLNVLLAEYRFALVRMGHRRLAIEKLCREASNCLEEERQARTGVEIVDLIMDTVDGHVVKPRDFTIRRPARGHTRAEAHAIFRAHAGTRGCRYKQARKSRQSHGNRTERVHFPTGDSRYGARQSTKIPVYLQAQAKDLRHAKSSLERLYAFEENMRSPDIRMYPEELMEMRAKRATAERRFVGSLTRFMRDAGEMDKVTAGHLRADFTIQQMGPVSSPSRDYLFSFYPWGQ